jgi:hypothetical protein
METKRDVTELAHIILWNDGIEEFVPEIIEFSRVAVKDKASHTPNNKILKAATHAAFAAMLLGLPLEEAVDTVLSRRGDILE